MQKIKFSASIITTFLNRFYVSALFASSFLPSSLPFPFLSVRIRRNLIGNQSFGGKNGVGLSVTVPWVPAAERGGQKRRLMHQIVFPPTLVMSPSVSAHRQSDFFLSVFLSPPPSWSTDLPRIVSKNKLSDQRVCACVCKH